MENLLISMEVMFPLAAWMGLGYALRSAMRLGDDWIKTTNVFAFKLLMPLLLFRNMVESDFAAIFSGGTEKIALYILAAYALTYIGAMVVVPRFSKDNRRRGVIIQGIIRANTSIYGIPIAMSLFGDNNIGGIAFMVGMMVPVFNITSVVALEIYREGKLDWKNVLLGIVKNPLIIGIAAGCLWNALEIPMPNMLRDAVWKLGACASPISFVVLGAGFRFTGMSKNRRALTAVNAFRLVVIPGVWLLVAGLLGFRGLDLLAVFVIFAPPTAVTSYAMASAMGGDPELGNQIVVSTSILSVATVFGWVFLLKSLGLI